MRGARLAMSSSRSSENKVVLLVALATMLIVGFSCVGLISFLSSTGTLDLLLAHKSAAVTATAPPTTAEPTASSTATPTYTASLVPATSTPTPRPSQRPSATPPVGASPSATARPLPTPTDLMAAARGSYALEYQGCIKHGQSIGTVKGRVYDRKGDIVVGAEIRVTLNDWVYDTPGITNEAGWYEFYLQEELKVKIVSLRIRGIEVPLVDNKELVLTARGGCFEHVNLRQQ